MIEEQKLVLEFIQDSISRLSQKSFLVKGWSAGVLGVSLTFQKSMQSTIATTCVMAGIILVFWFLNAVYLHNERLFRKLYNEKIKSGLSDYLSINLADVRGHCCCNFRMFAGAFLSRTVWPFHLPFLISVVMFIHSVKV
ncbi:hypothetical protein V1605_11880 [Enterobacter soli]|uniref:hypothetical protein n=1 Tax=Enterobacter soli TaxID=885040 RepID=UPI0037547837